ncbi:amidohydrolase family protein [Rhodococcus erythropolis]|nr:amidohydrolase family protein [Rhodococcus erythropolis]
MIGSASVNAVSVAESVSGEMIEMVGDLQPRRQVLVAERVLTCVPEDRGHPEYDDGPVAVLIEAGRIIAVGAPDSMPQDPEIDVVDFGIGSTMLPGLIDTHVHLAFDGGPDPLSTLQCSDDVTILALMTDNAGALLSAGVTTARDLGAPRGLDLTIKRRVNAGQIPAPRLQTVTEPLTVTGGHCWFLGGEVNRGVNAAREAVQRAHARGADAIKIMATGGSMTSGSLPYEAQFTAEEIVAVVDQAHKLGLKVAAHAHGVAGIRDSVAARVDSIEHFSFMTALGGIDPEPDVVTAVAQSGTFVCRTVCAAWGEVLKKRTPEPDSLRRLKDSGVRIVAGTDAGIARTPHVEYVLSLEGMAAFGMTNWEVIEAATSVAAESLGLGRETGSIAPGKAADLVVVRGDPLEDLGYLRNLEAVFTRGVRHVPQVASVLSWNEIVECPKYVPGLQRRRAGGQEQRES